MSHLRHASRHVHHSVAAYLEVILGELGWTSAVESERPFGAARVVVKRTGNVGRRDANLEPGQVYVTLGDEPEPDQQEMGGPLSRQDIPIFVDVLMDEPGLALALACDIRDALLGRFESAARSIDVVDQSTQTPVPGWRIRFEDVERIQPEAMLALDWQVVKVTAEVDFPEVRY
jgi:hypothetical protein